MKRIFTWLYGAWCILGWIAGAHEKVRDEPCNIEENRAVLTKLQEIATTGTAMTLTLENYDTLDVTTLPLTDAETETIKQLIMRMEPCRTNLDVDLEMSEWVLLNLTATVSIDVDSVMLYGNCEADGSYLLGHFTLTTEDYALWRRTIAQIRQRQ